MPQSGQILATMLGSLAENIGAQILARNLPASRLFNPPRQFRACFAMPVREMSQVHPLRFGSLRQLERIGTFKIFFKLHGVKISELLITKQ